MHITREIKSMRRRDMDKKEKFRLNADDMREDAELRKMIIEALAFNISRILPGGTATGTQRTDPDAQKAAEARQESPAERARARNNGNQHTGPRDPRQQ